MALISLDKRTSLVIAIDFQEGLLKSIWEEERVIGRAAYLIAVAKTLGIPVLATSQNPSRLGGLHSALPLDEKEIVEKMSFSCAKEPAFQERIRELQKDQVVIVGVETHICVSLTVNDLIEQGFEVVVCPDGTSAGNMERHKLGMERIRDAGAVPAHTESVAYEWTGRADDPSFKQILALTKKYR